MTSEDPRERLIEVALTELFREGAAPDYAPRVRARWEAARAEERQRPRSHASRERGAEGAAGAGPVVRGGPAAGPRRLLWVRVGLAAAAGLAAVVGWRALTPAPGPSQPVPAAFTLDAGLVAYPSHLGTVVWNPGEATAAVRLATSEVLALEPDAVLALEPGGAIAQATPSPLVIQRPLPRLLDGAVTFHAGEGMPRTYGFGNSPELLHLTPRGVLRAELARAAGPHPLAFDAGAAADQRTFGRGALLGPTFAALEPRAGILSWADVEGRRFPLERRFEGEVLDARGTVRPYGGPRAEALGKLLAELAPVPGVDPLPEWLEFEPWRLDRAEAELGAALAKSPALWVPVSRELARRFAAHEVADWWRGGMGVISRADSAAAAEVARAFWRETPRWFSTDALVALAERGVAPFDAELDALLARGPWDVTPSYAKDAHLPHAGPEADGELLALAAASRGDARAVGLLSARLGSLSKIVDTLDVSGDAPRVILIAATLARAGRVAPWDDTVARGLDVIAERLDLGETDSALMLAAALDTAAEALGLAPFGERRDAAPRLAYFEHHMRAWVGTHIEDPALLDSLLGWLETWRNR